MDNLKDLRRLCIALWIHTKISTALRRLTTNPSPSGCHPCYGNGKPGLTVQAPCDENRFSPRFGRKSSRFRKRTEQCQAFVKSPLDLPARNPVMRWGSMTCAIRDTKSDKNLHSPAVLVIMKLLIDRCWRFRLSILVKTLRYDRSKRRFDYCPRIRTCRNRRILRSRRCSFPRILAFVSVTFLCRQQSNR